MAIPNARIRLHIIIGILIGVLIEARIGIKTEAGAEVGTEAAIVVGIMIIAAKIIETATGRGTTIMGVIGIVVVVAMVVEIKIIIAMIEEGSRVVKNSSTMRRIGAIVIRIMVEVRKRTRCSL